MQRAGSPLAAQPGRLRHRGHNNAALTPLPEGELADGEDPDDDFDVLEPGRVGEETLIEEAAGSGAAGVLVGELDQGETEHPLELVAQAGTLTMHSERRTITEDHGMTVAEENDGAGGGGRNRDRGGGRTGPDFGQDEGFPRGGFEAGEAARSPVMARVSGGLVR